MKKFILCTVLLCILTGISFGQDTLELNKPMTSQDYLKRARGQKTAGFVFLGITGGIIAILAPGKTNFNTLGFFTGVAAASGITSIWQFIASGHNKRKGMLMLKSEKISLGIPYPAKAVNGISWVIPIGHRKTGS